MYAILNEIMDVSQLDTNQKQQHEAIKNMHHKTHIVYLRSPYSISGRSRTQQHQEIMSLVSIKVINLSSFTTLPLKLSQTMRI